ncbi:MAG: thiamine phosphate synthase [Candidatus Sphingomonas colombiensis]|nr:thiamine phosphate synthase [Sphingomonas sp.]WEK44514.1 MAG: thiamine phosphate synthase [Sphingomonas sp.]
MPPRHPVPRLWLMTDERIGDRLWQAVHRMPRGSGIVFRHYATPALERRRLFARLLRIARRRELLLVRAGEMRLAGEMGTHGRRGAGVTTWAAHSRREAVIGLRHGAVVLFISPVFPTRSHPGSAALGVRRATAIARGLPAQRIALGGMDRQRFARLTGFDGWAAIDAWL